MDNHGDIVKKASDYIFELFKKKLPKDYVYHNLSHAEDIAKASQKIGKKSGLSDDELEIVTVAALFHDTGYIEGCDNHEARSIDIATEFLRSKNYPEDKIEKVISCIQATKMPQSPQDILGEVICDADLSHLGANNFKEKSALLRLEWEKTDNRIYNELEWLEINLNMLTTHSYFTKFGHKELEDLKTDNLLKLRKRYKKLLKENEEGDSRQKKFELDKEKLDKKKESEIKPDRGIETMFRNVMRTHVEFSGMADNKANIMISINTLIIGGIVTILMRKLDTNPHLIIPTFLLLTVSLVCIILAIRVTRPTLTEGKFTKEDIKQKKTNLLFFGNFYKMGLEDFTWGMKEMMYDRDYLYGSMIKDFYSLGQVLGRKYRYLRVCYTIFLIGLVLSVIAFAVVYMYYPFTEIPLIE